MVTASRAEFAGGDEPGAQYLFEEHGGVLDFVTRLASLGPDPVATPWPCASASATEA